VLKKKTQAPSYNKHERHVMSVQYPKNTHLTLPSVEGAFTSLNILRDPPKSIHTRYIEKVGVTNKILEQIDGASDRACEAILPFARGVNPMVNVNYQNNGTNGGQVRYRYGSTTDNSVGVHTSQASLPYKVMRDGAFRPPVLSPRELVALSRQPRLLTAQLSNPGSERILQQVKCAPDMRAIRGELMNVCASTNASFPIETPHQQPYTVKYTEEASVLNTPMFSNPSSSQTDDRTRLNTLVDKEVNQGRTYQLVTTNVGRQQMPMNLQDAAGGSQPLPVKDQLLLASQTANASIPGSGDLIRGMMREASRNLPQMSTHTNLTHSSTNLDNTSMARDYYLPSRTSRGSFCNGGTQTTFGGTTQSPSLSGNAVLRNAQRMAQVRGV
jgi:hypothetical protein